ncbi:glycosyltransferase [Marinimicrobium sp. C2-29]|uniref:glycosyltransferase n=1 Tax=Marinimicrobium sp. C2-29 TaxID=3139825 RepID=UPI0031390091
MRNPSVKFAIVLHIYYMEVADRLLRQLSWVSGGQFSLWVTVPTELRDQAEASIDRYSLVAEIRDFDNTGMDVLPFLRLVPELVKNQYTAVVKLHTKRGQNSYGQVWGQALTEGMCREAVLRCIHRAFNEHPHLDFVGLAPFYLSVRRLTLDNEPFVEQLVDEIPELEAPPVDVDWGFFAGTVFAARLEPLLPLARWAKEYSHRFSSGYKSDGLWEHALERAFTLLARHNGTAIGLIHDGADTDAIALQRVRIKEGISQAYTRDIATQFTSLDEDYSYLSQCDLLDKTGYALDGELEGEIDLYRHYLLVGQFDHRRSASRAWVLKQHNERTLPWSRWVVEPRDSDLVSVIIPVFNQPELTEQCIRSLFVVRTDVQFEVVCVDNGSEPDTGTLLARLAREFSSVQVVRNETNLNFALGCNVGFGHSRGERVVFLNNDTEVTDGWLDRLVARLDVGDCFAAQPQLRYPDGTLQCMGVVFSDKSSLGYPIYAKMAPRECEAGKPRQFKALTAACLAVNASDFAEMRGFDALYINGQEDVDLCLRLHDKTGKLGAYVPESIVVHHESKSEGRGRWIVQNRKVFVHRWKGKISGDDCLYYEQDGFTVREWMGDNEQDDIRVFRPVLKVNSDQVSPLSASLKWGHRCFVQGDYAKALKNFVYASPAGGDLQWLYDQCITLVKRVILRKEAGQAVIICTESDLNAAHAALAELPEAQPALVLCLIPRERAGVEAFAEEQGEKMVIVSIHDRYSVSDQMLPVVLDRPVHEVQLLGQNLLVKEVGKLYQSIWGSQVRQI